MKKMNETLLAGIRAAHKHSFGNRDELKNSKVCGCFFCQEIFSPDEVRNYTVDFPDGTLASRTASAICPHCDVDSVIGDASGFPVEKTFLKAMGEYFF